MGGSLCPGGKFPRIKKKNRTQNQDDSQESSDHVVPPNEEIENVESNQPSVENQQESNQTKIFTFAQMVAATDNFNTANILGEGGFGKVYKGKLQENDQIVAIKKLDREGVQGTDEFMVEVGTLSSTDHPNLVKLIGYCCEAEERLLVYEYMALGSLDDHLHGLRPDSIPLDWNTRMKIATGTARGLAYLHDEMNPPIIYRDLKSSNILLDEEFNVKLSDFGLAKEGPVGDDSHVLTRVMGTYGYCAPDYAMTGHLTFKSDVYSLGVVLLELVTGKIAFDETKQGKERNIVFWTRPMLKDRKNFDRMVDPVLDGEYPVNALYEVLDIAAMCVQHQPNSRPSAAEVLDALSYVASQPYEPVTPRLYRSISV